MQYVPLKKGFQVDIAGPITKYLKKVDPAAIASLEKVQKQRNAVISITEYKGTNNIPDLKCYLSYLEQLEKLFPLTNDKVNKRTCNNN